MMNNKKITLPVVALRGMVVLPQMLIHFDINREITIAAVNAAMKQGQRVFLATQRDADVELPGLEDLYSIGTIATIRQVVKLPNDIARVIVSAETRGRLQEITKDSPYIEGIVEEVAMDATELSLLEKNAYIDSLKDLIEVFATVSDSLGKSVAERLLEAKELEKLVAEIEASVPLSLTNRLKLQQEIDPDRHYQMLAVILANEIELIRIKKVFQEKVKDKVDKNQKEYVMREQLKVIREELGETSADTDVEEYKKKLDNLVASSQIKERIHKEIDRFRNNSSSPSESAVIRNYIETLLSLPWDKACEDNNNLKRAEKILNDQHYGLELVKERVLETLAVRTLTKKGQSQILCLVGPPGTGKTSIAKSVAEALNKPYVRICLGGVRDEAEIRGHRKTYIGAMPGRIVNGLKQAKVKNPLMLLDEIDKVSNDYKGDTFSALLEVLDSEQNSRFVDHYVEEPIDLSEVLFIATANTLQTIPRPLLDRMEIIEVSSYTQNEKEHIAREHLIKKVMEQTGLNPKQLTISKKAIERIIIGYTKEAGVRNLERKLGTICRKAAKEIVNDATAVVRVTDKNLEKYLGKQRYTVELKNKEDEVGVVRGLAWTEVGGDTLQIEVNDMPGKGRLELTGRLGEVMKESARTGISYVRSISEKYGIEQDYFEKKDIHIHIPEGATPKDGPSAGITMATAVLSAITNTKVRADLAMTGEITLRGRVLPIGGLKEKILAAKTARISTVLVPKDNRKDVENIADEIKENIDIKYVDNMAQVIDYAFVK